MMHDPIKSTDWHHTIAPTRVLLHAVEEPLGAFWELFAANEHILTALEPSLGLVDFAPFAQLAVSDADSQPAQARPAPRRSSVYSAATPSLPTVGPPSIAASVSAARPGEIVATMSNLAKVDATPVFALPGRKSASAAVMSTATSQPTAQPLASNAHQSAAHASAYQPAYEAGQVDSMGDRPAIAQQITQRTLENSPSPAAAVAANGGGNPPVPVETMTLLATLTDALFTSPEAKGSLVESGEHSPGVRSHDLETPRVFSSQSHNQPPEVRTQGQADPAPLLDFLESNADNALAIQSFAPTGRVASSPALAERQPRRSLDDDWLSDSSLTTAAVLSQPDGWTLAQLINDVLAEEARRHGVDLS